MKARVRVRLGLRVRTVHNALNLAQRELVPEAAPAKMPSRTYEKTALNGAAHLFGWKCISTVSGANRFQADRGRGLWPQIRHSSDARRVSARQAQRLRHPVHGQRRILLQSRRNQSRLLTRSVGSSIHRVLGCARLANEVIQT